MSLFNGVSLCGIICITLSKALQISFDCEANEMPKYVLNIAKYIGMETPTRDP